MTYKQTLEYLYALTPAFEKIGAAAYKPGLGNMLRLMDALGNPHKDPPCIHIAGTNGKGSTSHILAAILQSTGYRTGLYTSPHLIDFAERIRVNGTPVSHAFVRRFVSDNEALILKVRPSFFEFTTAMAFCWFREQKTEINVIETGLGGRLDSTNVITPLVSIITNIGLEHTDLLGDTVQKIAAEKAGIIKRGVPVVVGEYDEATAPVFTATAEKNGCGITFASQTSDSRQIDRMAQICQLKGVYQRKNIATALCAIDALRSSAMNISKQAVKNGLAHVCDLTGLKGRWQTLRTNPTVICDIAHNPHGMRLLAQQLEHISGPLHIVLGMLADKDVKTCLAMLPKTARYYFTEPNSHRAMPASELCRLAAENGLQGKAYVRQGNAVRNAMTHAHNNGAVVITGSNYLVGEAIKRLQHKR